MVMEGNGRQVTLQLVHLVLMRTQQMVFATLKSYEDESLAECRQYCNVMTLWTIISSTKQHLLYAQDPKVGRAYKQTEYE